MRPLLCPAACEMIHHWLVAGPLVDARTGGESDAEFIAAGFSGNGMPQTFLAGRAVAEMAIGRRPTAFVEAFRPSSRPRPRSISASEGPVWSPE